LFEASKIFWLLRPESQPYTAVPQFTHDNMNFAVKSDPFWIFLHLVTALALVYCTGQYLDVRSAERVNWHILIVFFHCCFCILVAFNAAHLLQFSPDRAMVINLGGVALITGLLKMRLMDWYLGVLLAVPLFADISAFTLWLVAKSELSPVVF